jgi:pyruvate dehydrogenase E2 component (dihydrolipoamide acetyltransferase)
MSDSSLKVTPAVRDLAHRLNVDLTIVTPSGSDETITADDVQRVHKTLAEVGPLEKLSGARRAMALTMTQAREQAVPAMVTDDAILSTWGDALAQDMTLRLIRALVAGVNAEPSLNAWFDPVEIGRRVLPRIHVGITVDTPEGQFVCVMQDVAGRTPESLRKGLDKMQEDTERQSVPPEELRGYTITLSNFGKFGGRYASPVIVPPTVATVSIGRSRDAAVPVGGRVEIAKVLPVTVTYDQRAVTGGEAARFLAALIQDLEQAG